jgi:hypothetical protein
LTLESPSGRWASYEGRNFFALNAFPASFSVILRNPSALIRKMSATTPTTCGNLLAFLSLRARSWQEKTDEEIAWRIGADDIY